MSENSDMTCAELADVAAELALGVLTGRERALAVAHLDQCDACREDVRQLMATGEQFLELLPPAEPPAGFETRVLDRLGLPAPARPAQEQERQPGTGHSGRSRPDASRPGNGKPGRGSGPRGAGRTRPPGRLRRALAATAVGLAVIAAGLGGWRIGVGTTPAPSQLTSTTLLTAAHKNVGNIFLYAGAPRWVYMSVDLGSGNETVTCQLVGADGQVTTLGSFRLADGYGSWGSPDPGKIQDLRGARLVTASGTVLATATLAHW